MNPPNPPGDRNQKKTNPAKKTNPRSQSPQSHQSHLLCKDERFHRVYYSSVDRIQLHIEKREVDRWSGVLPGLPTFRYLLVCKHLRLVEGGDAPWIPDSLKAGATHEWWCWYQRRGGVSLPKKILFHQYAPLGKSMLIQASHVRPAHMRPPAILRAEEMIDRCAISITKYLAQVLQDLALIRTRLQDASFTDRVATSNLLHGIDDPHHALQINGVENDEAIESFWAQIILAASKKCFHLSEGGIDE